MDLSKILAKRKAEYETKMLEQKEEREKIRQRHEKEDAEAAAELETLLLLQSELNLEG